MRVQCLCGKIEFEFEPTDNTALNCYCSICQRSHGSGFSTQVISSKKTLRIIRGESYLSEYSSSEHGVRAFCACCGSKLMNYVRGDLSQFLSVSLAAITSAHQLKPSMNIHLASKADWVIPVVGLQDYEGFPDDFQKYL